MTRAARPQPVGDCAPVWVPPKTCVPDSRLCSRQATEAATPDIRDPEPTAAQANSGADGEAALNKFRGRDQRTITLSNSWESSLTCGWVSGVSSYPWTCAEAWHCETNAEHAVGCVSGTYSPLYTQCYDYKAWTNGLCSDTDPLTGCCESSQKPACVTYLWTDTPRRSMFRCGAVPAITSTLDAPQYVLDASSLSASRASVNNSTTRAISPSPSTTAPSSKRDASPVAPIRGLSIVSIVVLSLLLVLCCGGGAVYLRRTGRRNRAATGPRVDAADGMELRDMRARGGGKDGGSTAVAGVGTTRRSDSR